MNPTEQTMVLAALVAEIYLPALTWQAPPMTTIHRQVANDRVYLYGCAHRLVEDRLSRAGRIITAELEAPADADTPREIADAMERAFVHLRRPFLAQLLHVSLIARMEPFPCTPT